MNITVLFINQFFHIIQYKWIINILVYIDIMKRQINTNSPNIGPNYQISGIEPNYSYNGIQNLSFDQSSISTSGYNSVENLSKAVNEQHKFVNNYNNYKPVSTFDTYSNYSNSSNLPNLNNYSQFNIQKSFQSNKPIEFMQDTKNKHETLYDNLADNLLKESIKEYKLNIDSADRDIKIYPDPFNYVVFLGPVTNSGINASVSRTTIKNELKNCNKKNRNNQNHNNHNNHINNYNNTNNDDEKKIFLFDNPEAIKEYTINLEKSYNPYIIRDFVNVSYIKLDCAVVPKYNSIAINTCWDYCRKKHHKKNFFKDEYDRIKDYIILNDRYIPDDKNEYNPLGDRFIQIFIKELNSNRNFGTNPITDKSFILIYDKTLGALYLKLIPYSATKTFSESLLGNLTRLSIEFYNSWGEPLKINTNSIDYEINQISNTKIINPLKYNIMNFINSNNSDEFKHIIEHFNEIIKCFIMINYDIDGLIPFYTTENFNINENLKYNENLKFNNHCEPNCKIKINEKLFEIKNIYEELDLFVSETGFSNIIKKTKSNKKVNLSIDEFINNIFWFDLNIEYIDLIHHNIKMFDFNYKNFGFEILDKLKTEITNIPTNRNFQNFLSFLVGVWEDELNTKKDYRN